MDITFADGIYWQFLNNWRLQCQWLWSMIALFSASQRRRLSSTRRGRRFVIEWWAVICVCSTTLVVRTIGVKLWKQKETLDGPHTNSATLRYEWVLGLGMVCPPHPQYVGSFRGKWECLAPDFKETVCRYVLINFWSGFCIGVPCLNPQNVGEGLVVVRT